MGDNSLKYKKQDKKIIIITKHAFLEQTYFWIVTTQDW